MSISSGIKRVTSTALAVGAMVSAAALMAAPAASADNGQLRLCSKGNYASYVTFPDRGGLAFAEVAPGKCAPLSGLKDRGLEKIDVFGVDGNKSFAIGSGEIRVSKGGDVTTFGTPKKHFATLPAGI